MRSIIGKSFKSVHGVNYCGVLFCYSKDVVRRVATAWSKWRELSGVICDKKVPTKIKLLVYGNNRGENCTMGNGSEPVGIPEK